MDTIKAADLARLTQEDWQRERDKMLKTCNQCHSVNFAKQQLEKGDDVIRSADHLMAEAIRIVAVLYKDGVLAKPSNYAYAFPNLLTFHDAPTVIEQKLFVMYLKHRMRTFQGTFHAKPRLRSVVRMERDAAGPDRDQGIGSRDEAKPKRGRGNAENHSTERYTASQLI